MKKRKNLIKKMERLKVRLAKDAKKLAKLTVQLGAVVTAGKKKRKPSTGSRKAAKPVQAAASAKKNKPAASRKMSSQPAKAPAAKKAPPPKKKRTLNLTPERRAELAAAMKARWAAKRAASSQDPQNGSSGPGPSPMGNS